MKKKTNIRTIIRKIVREEVAMAIKEVITELKEPVKSKPIQEKHYSKNSVLNDVLNETAQGGDWETMGGAKYTSERMNEIMGQSYGDMMSKDVNGNSDISVAGQQPDFLKKDYRSLLKATEEKAKKHRNV